MKTPKNYTTQNVASYTVFYQENRPKMTSKYPFLSADQINCRLRDQWKKLAKGDKKNFSIPKMCPTPIKGNTGIKKKMKAEDQKSSKKSTPNKQLFCDGNPNIADLMLSKSLKQKSVADWLDANKPKLPHSGGTNQVKDVPDIYDRTPHIKTGILKNTERSLSLEKYKSEGRTPAKVTFTPINKKGMKLPITIRYSDSFKTGDESTSMEYIRPKNLNHDFEMDEGGQSEAKPYTCDFDEGDEDECNEIEREEYSDSDDDDNLLHYHNDDDNDEDTQQTQESDPKTPASIPASQTLKNTDQMVPYSSDASCTPKASKAPKPLKNGLTTPSESKRTLRPRKRNTFLKEDVEVPSFEKGISPKMFGLQKERGGKIVTKETNSNIKHTKEKQHHGSEEIEPVMELMDCQIPEVSQCKETETNDAPNERKKNGRKDKKKKDEDTAEIPEESGFGRATKRKTRNKKPVYDDNNLRESGDFDDLGNITSKKKMKTKVLPGLFDEYDIELTSKEECIRNQDKLISEFPLFQQSENKMKNNLKDDVKNGIGYDFKKIGTEKLQELPVKSFNTIKTIKETPQKHKSAKSQEKENLNLNNNNIDHDIERVIEDYGDRVKKANQDIVDLNNNSESLDGKEETSLFGLKSFTDTFKLGKPDSFSSSYDDDFEEMDDQPSSSTGNNTLQKILSSLRQIGSQSSHEDEEGNILDADDEPIDDDDESPKILSPILSGVSELSSLSEIENNQVNQPAKKSKVASDRKQSSRAKQGMCKETEDLEDEPPEFCDVNNKVIPRGEIYEMFDEIPPPNKKSKKNKERRYAASNQQAGISNFGVLFHEEDIFL